MRMNMDQLEALHSAPPPYPAKVDYGSSHRRQAANPGVIKVWQMWLCTCFAWPFSCLRNKRGLRLCFPEKMDNSERTRFIIPTGANPRTWVSLIYITYVVTVFHFICGAISMGVGVITTIAAEHTIYAHTVSPIWSGLSFVVAGFCGINAARRRTVYMIHLFIGTSVCALILLLISIQLLRLGLVYHTSDGNTYQKDQKDIWIIIALSDAGAEGLFCVIAVVSSWKMARLADVPPEPVKDDGPFHIQITKGGSHYMTMSKYTNKRKISSL